MVLLPIEEYETLLERLQFAPKTGKYNPLSTKQKRKVREQIEAACVVIMQMSEINQQPLDVQHKMEETLH